MSETILLDDPPVEIAVRRRANARRITLRVTVDGVAMTLPKRCRLSEAESFAQAQAGWLREKLVAAPKLERIDIGADLPFEGETLRVVEGLGARVRKVGDCLEVPRLARGAGPKIAGWLKGQARDRLVERSDFHAEALGTWYEKVSLRDTRSRWGSCSSQGNLMYSWRLIMAPKEVLDYVAAHEVAHLKEMNHGPKFWALVEQLCPDYPIHRTWLRKRGQELQRIKFTQKDM